MNDLQVVPLGTNNINSIFKVTFQEKNYILRISNFNNIFESKVLKKLKNENINCPIIKDNFVIDHKYIMICDYINGSCPRKINMIILRKLMLEVKKLHRVKFHYHEEENSNYESLEQLKEYYKIAAKSSYLKDHRAFISRCIKRIEELDFNTLSTCIVHSDIKSENIVVDGEDVYLIDFGNVYIGNRLIDLIRIIMWFFIRYDNLDFEKIKEVIDCYFVDNDALTKEEFNSLEKLLEFCLLYNLVKDIYLYENHILNRDYIESCSLKWFETLKNGKVLKQIVGVFG